MRVPGPTRYLAVPGDWTVPTPEPPPPVPLCVHPDGPVLCETQLALWLRETQGALTQCNADKAAIALLPPERQ